MWEEMVKGTHLHYAERLFRYGFLPHAQEVDVKLPVITSAPAPAPAPLRREDSGKTAGKKLGAARHAPGWLTGATCSSSTSPVDEVYGPSSPPKPLDL